MVTDYFEAFTLLEKVGTSDGLGSECLSWEDVTSFRGGLTQTTGNELHVGGRVTARLSPALLHEIDVTLQTGDHVRRERDGSIWRVIGSSGDMRTPALATQQLAQVAVERLVIPC